MILTALIQRIFHQQLVHFDLKCTNCYIGAKCVVSQHCDANSGLGIFISELNEMILQSSADRDQIASGEAECGQVN